jgi:hypothetical protein
MLFAYIPGYALTQQSYMRIKSTTSETQAKWLMLSIIPFCFIFLFMAVSIGFVAYAYFERCGDPFKTGLIENQNQLLTQFLVQFFADYNGLLGVFIGVLVSSSIGIISNILKALAITLTHDLYNKIAVTEPTVDDELVRLGVGKIALSEHKDASHSKLKRYSKKYPRLTANLEKLVILICTVFIVLISIGFEYIPGSLTAISLSIQNSVFGSILFIYMCAKFNDHLLNSSNNSLKTMSYSSFRIRSSHLITGCLVSFLFVNFLYVGRLVTMGEAGSFYHFDRTPFKSSVPYDMPHELETFCNYPTRNFTHTFFLKKADYEVLATNDNDEQVTFFNYLFGISFTWYACIGFFTCFVTVMILHLFTFLVSFVHSGVSRKIILN